MRVFYVIFPQERDVNTWLNLLRFVAGPEQKHIAHITIRGPYTQRYSLASAAKVIQGHRVRVVDGWIYHFKCN